jgi:hypothetical protein
MFRGCLASCCRSSRFASGTLPPDYVSRARFWLVLLDLSLVCVFVANAFHVVTCAATSDVPYRLTAIESNSQEKDVAPQLKTRCKLALRG